VCLRSVQTLCGICLSKGGSYQGWVRGDPGRLGIAEISDTHWHSSQLKRVQCPKVICTAWGMF